MAGLREVSLVPRAHTTVVLVRTLVNLDISSSDQLHHSILLNIITSIFGCSLRTLSRKDRQTD